MRKQSSLKFLALSLGLFVMASSTTRAQTASGWKGTTSSDMQTAANWDNGFGSSYSLFIGNAWVTAGSSGSTTLNNASAYSGYRLTFESIASPQTFTVSGSGITLFNFGSNVPKIENYSTANQNITAPISMSYATGSEINAVNGDLTLSGGLTTTGPLSFYGTKSVNLSGSSNSIAGNMVVYNGRVNITSGTTNAGGTGGFNNLGNTASTTAVTSISSGATLGWLTQYGGNFGSQSSASGVLYNSGTFSMTGTDTNNSGLYLGNAANAYGYLRNDSGATTTVSGRLWIAQAGNAQGATGVLDVRGGTVTVSGTNQSFDRVLLINGDGNTHATSTSYAGINLVDGTLTVGKSGAQVNINGAPNNGNGTYPNGSPAISVQNTYTSFNITGTGKFTAGTGDSGIGLGVSSNATNIATLSVSNGGTLETGYIYSTNSAGTNVLNFDNGTIRAIAADGNGLIQGTNIKAYIYSGGVTVDTNGFSTFVSTPLLSPTGSGVTGISLGGTATGYVGAPVVKISGGGGIGAAAVANFDPTTGTVTGITITAAGAGYTSAPTVTLVGGNGGSTGAGTGTATATASIAAVTGGGLTKTGAGTLTLTAANTYTGDTTISNGTLQAGVANAIPSGSGKGNVVLNGGASTAGIFDINGLDVGINGLSGTSNTVLGKVVNNATGTNKTLTVGNNSATSTFAGVIADHTSGTGTVALTKTGSGTQTLTGTNTYSGATTISGGTLKINGLNSSAGAYSVQSGGTLAGSGTIATASNAGITLSAGAKLSPGDGVGTLTANLGSGVFNISAGVNLTNTQSLLFDLTTTAASDRVLLSNTSSTFNIGSGVLEFDDFVFTTGAGFGPGTYTLLDGSNASGITGTLGTHLSGMLAGYNAIISFGNGGLVSGLSPTEDIILTVTAVPEPATYGALAGLLLSGLSLTSVVRRRSKRTRA